MTGTRGRRRATARRSAAPTTLLWLAGALALGVMILGVNGTLSDWTAAVIGNSTNTAATTTAVILQETGPASQGSAVCRSSDGTQSTVNSSTCSTINTYGSTATPLIPGTVVTTDATFKNIGGANGTGFALAPDTCAQSPIAGSGTPAAADLCTNGDLTVAISCSPGATFNAGSAWADLAYSAGVAPTATKTHAGTGGDLNAASTWTCRTTVTLSSSARIADQGITLTQPLTWTLNG